MTVDDFLQVATALPEPVMLLTAQGRILAVNPAAGKQLGVEAGALTGQALQDLVAPEQAAKLGLHLRNWAASRQPLPAPLKLRQSNGEYLECHCHGGLFQPRRADQPAWIMLRSQQKSSLTGGFIALNEKIAQLEKEIMERRQFAHALAESEAQVRLLLDSTGEAIYGVDLHGNCTFVNAACLKLLGYDSSDELLGRNMHELIHHTHADGTPYPRASCRINQVHVTGESTRADNEVLWSKDGRVIPIAYTAYPIRRAGELQGSVVTFQDISEQRAIEAALARSQQALELGQAIAHIGSWDWDIVNNDLHWSDEIYRIFGLEPQAFGATYEAFLESVHAEDRDAVIQAVKEAVADENAAFDIEHRVVHPDGTERIVNERGYVYRDAHHNPVRMIGSVQDITEKKEAETYKSMLFDTSPIGLALCDMQGKLIDINSAYARILGRDIEEAKQLTYWEITPEDYAEQEQQQLDSLNRTGHYGPYEKEYLHKDGHRVPVRLRGQIVEFEGEQYIWSSVEDITEAKQAKDALQRANLELEDRVEQRTLELKAANKELQSSLGRLQEAQKQLVESEKMASLGGLVAGVAHEINTPVGVGVTAVSHLQMKIGEYADRYHNGQLTRDDFEVLLKTATESSQIIHHNLDRAAELIRSFKQVAVDQTSNEVRPVKLSEYLQKILQSLKPRLKKASHEVIVNCPEELEIHTYAGALSQVMTNLIMNSVIHGFADRQHGRISINVTKKLNGSIRLDYSDNGKGIAADNLHKIFEPFFTTRRGQGGSGLGMHITYNLVTQSLGGKIHCSSTEGVGTNFRIELPDISGPQLSPVQVQAGK